MHFAYLAFESGRTKEEFTHRPKYGRVFRANYKNKESFLREKVVKLI